MLHFNGYDVILLLLPCDLIKQEMLCVAAGALDRTGLKGIGQVRVAQGLQIAAAAPVLQRFSQSCHAASLFSAYFFLNSIAPMVVSV